MNIKPLADAVNYLTRRVDEPYSRRFSLDYRVSVVSGGEKKYSYRRQSLRAHHNSVALAEPGEVHEGAPVGDFFDLRMLSLTPETFVAYIPDGDGGVDTLPTFAKPVINDLQLSSQLCTLFDGMDGEYDAAYRKLYVEEALQSIIATLTRYSTNRRVEGPLTRERYAIRKSISVIHDSFDETLSLDQLARASGLPKYRFLRAFRVEMGLPPHRYQLNLRVEKAKRMIALGKPLAQVALDSGFHDQSHFHRHFSDVIGLSPMAYRRAISSAKKMHVDRLRQAEYQPD